MVVGGTGLVFVAGTPPFAFFGRLFDRAFWPRTPDTATRQFEAWIYSVLGATIAGWACASPRSPRSACLFLDRLPFHRAVPTAMSVQTRSGRKRFNAPLHCGVR
jgi:hypothetical protein